STWRATRFEGTTTSDGTFEFALPPGHNYGDFIVLARSGSMQSFALSNVSWPSSGKPQYRVFATTDRPAYRPGHLVQWKFTVRAYDGAVYGNPGRTKLRYVIRDPMGTEIKADKVELNDFGSAFATLETTATMTLGEYAVTFEADDGSHIGGSTLFRLEEYKLPEFEVAVKPASKDGKTLLFRVGDVLTADVVANYYFGGAVRDATVEVLVKQRPYFHVFPRRCKYEWLYETNDHASWWRYGGEQIVQRTTTKTDADGIAHVTFQTPEGVDGEFEYEIEARVVDASRREVTGSGSVRVTQRAYAVEVHLPHRLTKPGDSVDATLRALDANGSPVAAEGQVTVTRRTYREIWTRPDGATAPTMRDSSYTLTGGTYDDEPITSIAAATDANGEGSIRFVAPREGYYRIVWTSRDDRGMQVVGEASTFVVDANSKELGYRGQELELIVDTDTFKSGTQAPFMITTRNSGRWVLFVAVADRMLEHRVIHVEGRAKLATLNVGPEHVPNAFLSVFGWSNSVAQQSQVEIVVPPEQQFLDVAVAADATDVEPGTNTKLKVTVKDANGEPVRTELSLAVTDAAVSAIQGAYAGDPRPFFYGDRRWMQLAVGSSSFWRTFTRLRDGKNGVYDELAAQSAPAADGDDTRFGVGGGWSVRGIELYDSSEKLRAAAPAAATAASSERDLGLAMRSESKMMGGAPADDPAVKVRSDFRETALWLPTLVTNELGIADVAVSWPDSLTRWTARAIGFDGSSRCGEGSTTVRTRKPLMVRLQAPRFFVVGDEVTLSAVLNNDTDAPMMVTPTLILEGLELLGRWKDGAFLTDGFDAYPVPAHGEARADWRVRATKPGTARFSVTAKADRCADAMEKTYPVFAHGVDVFAATSGKMRGDSVTSILDLPALRNDGSTRFSVQVAPSLAVATLDALPYLIDYPYGCTEQTMSRFLPAVITAKTLRDQGLSAEDVLSRVFGGVEREHADKTHSKSAGLARLDDVTTAALARLADMQHGDGGFGWWKTGDSDRFMTAYVVFGLTLAHEAGVDVDLNLLANAAQYLDRTLVEEERRPDMQAWMLHALATYGARVDGARRAEFAEAAYANLWSKHRDLNAYSRSLFALAALALGHTDEARVLVDNLKNGVIRDEAPESSLVKRGNERVNAATIPTAHWGEDGIAWRWSDGGVEATAWAIRALLAVDPKHELVEPAVHWLLRNRRGNQWSNTRDTAICVLAMNDYLRVSGELGRTVGYRVRVNGSVVAERTVAPAEILAAPSVFPVDASVLVAGANEITIERTSGDGPLYFSAQASFFSTEERVQPRGNEIFVRRTYWKLVPRPTLLKGVVYDRVPMKDGDRVTSGDRVEVVLTIEAKNHFEYLVFEDLKPAGLEAVSVRSGEPLYAQELKRGETEHRFGDDGEEHESTTGVRVPGQSDAFGTTGRTAWIHTELRDR
ncbi:MAG: alpha-2-macroglobulin, partial [Planctomycetes bacterium]|nr:alpha-2-macroglobulin [Planctomycetota bacterium]